MSEMLSSWSRRRAAVAAEAEEERLAAAQALEAREQAALEEKSDAEILEELGLPDPDTLEMGDDFKRFMARAVPQRIRQRALRKLWRSNPVLACVDGLNDYDGDFLTGSTGQGVIRTSYQVGKGMLAHLLEQERLAEQAVAGPSDAAAPVCDVPPEQAVAETVAFEEVPVETARTADPDAPVEVTPAPRRMRFEFAGERT